MLAVLEADGFPGCVRGGREWLQDVCQRKRVHSAVEYFVLLQLHGFFSVLSCVGKLLRVCPAMSPGDKGHSFVTLEIRGLVA